MTVLIAPDKFKGSLTAPEVAEALASGLRRGGVHSIELPLADGGDGTVDACLRAGFGAVPVATVGPLGDPVDSRIAFDGTTAVVEVANTCGLVLAGGCLDALGASSRGFGVAIAAALRLGPRRLVLGLGGSASTDGGMGALAALGARFADAAGHELSGRGADLHAVASVELSGLPDLSRVEVVCAKDVDSPLFGPLGSAHVFAQQKGADADARAWLDAGLVRLAELLGDKGRRLASTPGAGAAGGLGFACALLGARSRSGAGVVLDLVGFDERLAQCSAVVTGEGRLDAQTLAGKLPAVVARRSGRRPVFAVVGRNDLAHDLARGVFSRVDALVDRDASCATDPELTARLLADVGEELARLV